MSPHTAFLVLETEREYVRYKIDRRARHRYWRPVAMAKPVLLPEYFKPLEERIRSNPPAQDVLLTPAERAEFEEHLKAARAMLAKGEPTEAMLQLMRISRSEQSADKDAYEEVMQQVRQALSNDAFLSQLGVGRSLLQRQFLPSQETSRPKLFSMTFGGVDKTLHERHPQARALMTRIRGGIPTMRLDEFGEFLEERTGVQVLFDETALAEDGIALDEEINVRGVRDMSVRNVLSYALRDFALTYYETPEMLYVTTEIKAEEVLVTRMYPVVDLVRTDVLPQATQWFSPFADADALVEHRLRNKLERKLDVNFDDTPLQDVADWLADELQENLLIDETALAEDGIATDEPITLSLRNVPVRVALERINEPLGLDWFIGREALLLTTEVEAEQVMETRVYPAVGLIYTLPVEGDARRRRGRWGGGFGGMGSGGFGGGFAGGFGAGFGGMAGAMGGGMGGGAGFFGGGAGGGWINKESYKSI